MVAHEGNQAKNKDPSGKKRAPALPYLRLLGLREIRTNKLNEHRQHDTHWHDYPFIQCHPTTQRALYGPYFDVSSKKTFWHLLLQTCPCLFRTRGVSPDFKHPMAATRRSAAREGRTKGYDSKENQATRFTRARIRKNLINRR